MSEYNGAHERMDDPASQNAEKTIQAIHAHQDEWLAAYLGDELSPDEQRALTWHLAQCDQCQQAVAQATRIQAALALLRSPLAEASAADTANESQTIPTQDLPILPARPLFEDARISHTDARVGAGALPTDANKGTVKESAPRTVFGGDRQRMKHDSRFDDLQNGDTGATRIQARPPVTPTPRRNRSFLALAATLALVALAGALFASLATRHGGLGGQPKATPTLIDHRGHETPQPTGVPFNGPTGLPINLELSSVQMFSANDGWAVGTIQRPGSSNSSALGAIIHYSNGRWKLVGPLFPSAALASIAMLSDTEGWIVGCSSTSSGASQIVILHDHNSVWSAVPLHITGCLFSISMVSASDGWAVGASNIGKAGSLLLHCIHGEWVSIPTTLHALQAISMISSSEGLFVGNDGTIGQYQNGAWTQWPQGAIGTLNAVQMVSANDGWAVGFKAVSQPSGEMAELAYIMRYDGSSWQEVSAPSTLGQAQLNGVAMVSPTQGWAVGATVSNTGPNGSCVILHYQNGAWQNTPILYAGQLDSVSMVSANEGWAVGYSYNSDYTAVNALLLHYQNGTWSVYSV